jgi:hypothetical protein
LQIANKGLVFISCAKCGHSITYAMHQKPITHKLEYKIISDGKEEQLNALGADGWDAFAVIRYPSGPPGNAWAIVDITDIYLKRKVIEEV